MFKFLLGIGFYHTMLNASGALFGSIMTVYGLLFLLWLWRNFGYHVE